jgi:alanine-synthesizing transaminase
MAGMFSRRTELSRVPNRLEQVLGEQRQAGRTYLDLTTSNPTACGLPYDARAIAEALSDSAALRYEPDPFGLASARGALADELTRLGRVVRPERIMLTASTSEAYGYAFKLLCDPGDELLVPAPSYPLFEHLTRFEGVRALPYRLEYDGAWHIDLDSVRAAAGPRTRAIIVVSPNNPTGSYLKRDELEALAGLGLPLIADEVFATYPLVADDRRVTTAAEAEGVLTLCLSGLSKLAGLPQMKLAWTSIAGPAPLVEEALARLELIADANLSVSTPVQVGLGRLLGAREPTERALCARLRHNLGLVERVLRDGPATPLFVEGGWYVVLRLPRTHSEEQWVLALLRDDGVLVQPGWFYDFATEPFAVLSLITEEATFAKGVELIAERARRGPG